jgi:hypothetical protein
MDLQIYSINARLNPFPDGPKKTISIKSFLQEDDIKIQMYGEELLEEEEEELALDKEAIVLEEEEESPNAAPPIPNASSFFVFGPKNP